MGATTVLTIWKVDEGRTLPTDPRRSYSFDLAVGGVTAVYRGTATVPVDLAKPFELPLAPSLPLDPGTYLVAWYFTFDNPLVFGVRFGGEVNGRIDGGGFTFEGAWIDNDCRYRPVPDTSPPGSTAYVADQWAPPSGIAPSGPFPSTIGYQTWFRAYAQKTPRRCVKPTVAGWNGRGVPVDTAGRPVAKPYFTNKWPPLNTGDLNMEILGTPR